MNWLRELPPGIKYIRGLLRRKSAPKDFWMKDPTNGSLVPRKEVEANLLVFPGSEYHLNMPPRVRLEAMFDGGAWELIEVPKTLEDPLRFRIETRYADRLKAARKKTSNESAIVVGHGTLDGLPVVMFANDFGFIGGTLATAEGEAVLAGFERAAEDRVPLIAFIASGGARVQEGIFSLMQMPRTTIAVQKMREAKLPYIVVLTNPTYGGVTASYGMLGDITIAEPGAHIGFAGPDLIKPYLRYEGLGDFPEGFQSAESSLKHGFVDMIVHRHNLRQILANIYRLLTESRTLSLRHVGPHYA